MSWGLTTGGALVRNLTDLQEWRTYRVGEQPWWPGLLSAPNSSVLWTSPFDFAGGDTKVKAVFKASPDAATPFAGTFFADATVEIASLAAIFTQTVRSGLARAFLVDLSGRLVAASSGGVTGFTPTGEVERALASASGDSFVAHTAVELGKRFPDLAQAFPRTEGGAATPWMGRVGQMNGNPEVSGRGRAAVCVSRMPYPLPDWILIAAQDVDGTEKEATREVAQALLTSVGLAAVRAREGHHPPYGARTTPAQ